MTLEDIKKEVQRITDISHDDESAHMAEDYLHNAFIEHVAKTAGGELAEMAREVLKTSSIDFCRWYA